MLTRIFILLLLFSLYSYIIIFFSGMRTFFLASPIHGHNCSRSCQRKLRWLHCLFAKVLNTSASFLPLCPSLSQTVLMSSDIPVISKTSGRGEHLPAIHALGLNFIADQELSLQPLTLLCHLSHVTYLFPVVRSKPPLAFHMH